MGTCLQEVRRWLFTEDDVKDMYHEYSGKQEILLWCHGKPDEGKTSKRSSPDLETGTKGSKAPRTSNYEIHRQKLEEVQEIKDDLKEHHGGKYTPSNLVLGHICFKWDAMIHETHLQTYHTGRRGKRKVKTHLCRFPWKIPHHLRH